MVHKKFKVSRETDRSLIALRLTPLHQHPHILLQISLAPSQQSTLREEATPELSTFLN